MRGVCSSGFCPKWVLNCYLIVHFISFEDDFFGMIKHPQENKKVTSTRDERTSLENASIGVYEIMMYQDKEENLEIVAEMGIAADSALMGAEENLQGTPSAPSQTTAPAAPGADSAMTTQPPVVQTPAAQPGDIITEEIKSKRGEIIDIFA